jgi:hypothetical protein
VAPRGGGAPPPYPNKRVRSTRKAPSIRLYKRACQTKLCFLYFLIYIYIYICVYVYIYIYICVGLPPTEKATQCILVEGVRNSVSTL